MTGVDRHGDEPWLPWVDGPIGHGHPGLSLFTAVVSFGRVRRGGGGDDAIRATGNTPIVVVPSSPGSCQGARIARPGEELTDESAIEVDHFEAKVGRLPQFHLYLDARAVARDERAIR